MITGKTAALLAACTEIGALIGNTSPDRRAAYRLFGQALGLAFQIWDDLLGIWGNEQVTGKSADSDLVAGKKSLPVLFGLSQNGPFARRWKEGPITHAEAREVAALLEAEGARAYTSMRAEELTVQALVSLENANPQVEAGLELRNLAHKLLKRTS